MEDSGIFINQAFDNTDQLEFHRGLEIDENNNTQSMNFDPVQLLKTKENDGVQNALVSTLFNPLESELDESLDIAMELDISLSESFDVNEVLSSTTKGDNSVAGSLIKSSLTGSESVDNIQQSSEQISVENRISVDKDQCFKQSFTPLPEVRPACKNERLNKKTKCHSGAFTVDLTDHSYSKIVREVKFVVKSRKSAGVWKPEHGPKDVTVQAGMAKCSPTVKCHAKVPRHTVETFRITCLPVKSFMLNNVSSFLVDS